MLLFELTELTEAIQYFYLYKIFFSAPGYRVFFYKRWAKNSSYLFFINNLIQEFSLMKTFKYPKIFLPEINY